MNANIGQLVPLNDRARDEKYRQRLRKLNIIKIVVDMGITLCPLLRRRSTVSALLSAPPPALPPRRKRGVVRRVDFRKGGGA